MKLKKPITTSTSCSSGVFDKGAMEDGEGVHIDFKNTTLLLTTNAGAELISQLCEDPALMPDSAGLKEALMPELRKHFPAAFPGV